MLRDAEREEGFGLVYLEAMRLGRPCLVNSVEQLKWSNRQMPGWLPIQRIPTNLSKR